MIARTGETTDAWLPSRRVTGAIGLVGGLFFGFYFGVPALFPDLEALVYSPSPATSSVVAIGARYQQLVTIGTWLQAIGATLCVVYFFGLLRLAGAAGSLAGQVVQFAGAVLVALVLLEGVFTLTWVSAAAADVPESARAGYDLMAHFIQVFPLVPAPAVYLPLGWVLVRSGVVARWLAWAALSLGVAFVLVGMAEVFVPFAQAFAAGLAGLQDLWILISASVLLARGRRAS